MPDSGTDWVIVSGADGSIGSGLVERFLARGRPVLALDRTEERVGGFEGSARLVVRTLDLASETEVKAVLDEARRTGSVPLRPRA